MFREQSTVNLQEVKKEFDCLHEQIQRILHRTGPYFDNVIFDHNNLEETFLRSQYYNIAYKLNDIERHLTYMSKSVVEEGKLLLNAAGRYELPSGEYLNSGSTCEILSKVFDEDCWVYTTIEHNGKDYYATTLGRDVSINGMIARIRR